MKKLLLLLLLMLVATGCGLRSTRLPPLPDSRADEARGLLPLGNCVLSGEPAFAKDLKTLAGNSTWVVEGTIEAMTGTRNLALARKGVDPNLFIEGVDFRVKVERYLQGYGPKALTISLERSQKRKDEARACRNESYTEPLPGSRWILFLRPSEGTSDLAEPAGFPWRYSVVGGQASPVLPGSHPAFPPTTVEKLRQEIQ